MATISDVAQRAGVSISTVSYVLSGKRPISLATRARIFAAMEETGFQPNAMAQGLARGKSHLVALLMGPSNRDLGKTELEFVNGAARTAREKGYHLVLWANPIEIPQDLEKLGQSGLVDGVLLMEVTLNDWRISILKNIGIPCAMIGHPENGDGLDWVDIDFSATISRALDWAEDAGHLNVALINQSQKLYDEGYGPTVRIHESFISQCAERHIGSAAVFCEPDAKSGNVTIHKILDSPKPPTLLLTMNDAALSGILHGITERGLTVPHDISVISLLSSPEVACHFWPPMSTMDVPGTELGRLGIVTLIDKIESGGTNRIERETLLPCTLSLRGTTAQRKNI